MGVVAQGHLAVDHYRPTAGARCRARRAKAEREGLAGGWRRRDEAMNEHLVGLLSRRAFLQGLSAAGIAAALPRGALAASIGASPGLGLESAADVSPRPPPAPI